jgi:PAS domain S-box-containing protein
MATVKEETKKGVSPAGPFITSPLENSTEKKTAGSHPVNPGAKIQDEKELIHELQVHQIELEVQAEELRRVQLALAESRDEYLDLYEFAPVGYLTLTDTAMIVRANLTVAVVLGVDRNQLSNNRFRKWIVPMDLEKWDRYFANILQSEEKLSAIIMLRRGDGSTFPARLVSIRFIGAGDGAIKIRMAVSDISDIRTAETALSKSEERFRLAEEAKIASEIPYRRLSHSRCRDRADQRRKSIFDQLTGILPRPVPWKETLGDRAV